MKLRVISGNLKSHCIKIPDKKANFRPTKEIVREAVAGYLNERIRKSIIADICAGSGMFGFEMLSRGAQCAHFVDNNRVNCRNIIKHAQQLNIEKQCFIFNKDVRDYLRECEYKYDIVYYDPPYNDLNLVEIIQDLLLLISKNGILIYEHKKTLNFTARFSKTNEFTLETRRYGETIVDLFSR